MRSLAVTLAVLAIAAVPALAADPTSVPVIGKETPRGTHGAVNLPAAVAAPRALDGSAADWSGVAPGFSGAIVRSRGELVYTDHLFDAHGPDDGRDADALAQFETTQSALPEAYRLEAIMRNDPAGQVGAPWPDQLAYKKEYGDLGLQDKADLVEVRAGVQNGELWLLGRTTTMTATDETALLVLLDTIPGETERTVPFGANLTTRRGDVALLLAGATGWRADLETGTVTELPAQSVATDPAGYNNAIEARIGGVSGTVGIAVAAGRQAAGGTALANVANVAFRTAEPVREWSDKQQALALHADDIDAFFTQADLSALAAGANQRYVPKAGYHERVFTSSASVARESGDDGLFQQYGVYLPRTYVQGTKSPLQLWLHWRGGNAHSAGATIPRLFTDLGEEYRTVVISPSARGSSTWYVGKGHVDVMDVWQDAHATFSIDESRRYVAGHSMGGWGSFLLSITHPDWFAAALPASPPVTQGAWTGLDFEGCDDLAFDGNSPCYIEANGSDPRTQHTRRLLENTLHVPWAIYHGAADELVPVSGVARQVERLVELGYRHRFYLFPTQEHFGPPVWDQWAEGAAYMHRFRIPSTPREVVFKRDMPFERATERISSDGVPIDLRFDRAYWMSGLEPADPVGGVASFTGTALAVYEGPRVATPEAGGPVGVGQTGPFTMTGLAWTNNPLAALPQIANGFTAELTGARAVTLALPSMRIDMTRPATGTVKTDRTLDLALAGPWTSATLDGLPTPVTFAGGVAHVTVPSGTHSVTVLPG